MNNQNSPKDPDRLSHIIEAIGEINKFVSRKSFQDLESDRILSLALIKEIEIIGEAASKLSENLKSDHPQIPWNKMVAMRNRLIHGYFDVDIDFVWATIHKDLKNLEVEIEKIFNSYQ